MKNYKNTKTDFSHLIKLFSFLLIVVLVFSSCSITGKTDNDGLKKKEMQKTEIKKKITPVHIKQLSNEANRFIQTKDYKRVLAIYEFLLSKVEKDHRNIVMSELEKVLAQLPAEVLQKWLQKDKLYIPRPLLMYFTGYRYALDKHPDAAINILEDFLSQYPYHRLYKDASDMLETVKNSIFRKRTLGCLLPLSGRYGILGQKALNGIQLALYNLSKKYSTEFKIVIEDTQSDPKKAAEGVKKLSEQNVIGILGPLSARDEAGREAGNLQIPMIALTQQQDFALQGDYLFTNSISPEMQIQALGTYLFAELGNIRAVILYPDEKYGQKYMELFREMAEEYEVNIIAEKSYDGSLKDYSEVILDLKKTLEVWYLSQEENLLLPADNGEADASLKQNIIIPKDIHNKKEEDSTEEGGEEEEEEIIVDCQVIFIPDSPSRINLILPQLAFNDIGGMYLAGTNLWHNKNLLKGSEGYHRFAVIPDGFFKKSSRYPETQAFVKDYKAVFNSEPEFIEAIAYDTTGILLTAAMDEDVRSREDLKNFLKSGLIHKRVYNGVTGTGIFDEKGLIHKPLFMLTIKDNKFVEIDTN